MSSVPGGPAAVTGGTGYTGRRLLRRLADAGVPTRVLVRPASDRSLLPEGVIPVEGELDAPSTVAPALAGARIVYHLAHVRFTASVVAALPAGVERLVVVSSLRALSRVPCPSVDAVLQGEAALADCPAPWTILRPSMIFGPGDDRNLSRLAATLRRWPCIPVAGARCLHQPVFVEDVIDAILACPGRAAAAGRTYAIAGPEALTYADLIAAVGAAVGRRPRRVPVPAAAVAALLAIAEKCRVSLPISASQVRRLLEDKAYDIGPARRDLGFAPLALPAALARIHGAGTDAAGIDAAGPRDAGAVA